MPWLPTARGDEVTAIAGVGVMTGKATGEALGFKAAVPPCSHTESLGI